MFRYTIIFILTNIVYCSVGHPIQSNETDDFLAKSLQSLANHCENSFLATQIKTKFHECNFSFAQNKLQATELECFIFYDINRQLCSAFRDSKFDLGQRYAAKMNTVKKVKETCDQSKNWKFTKIPEHPKYDNISAYFQKNVLCLTACVVHDLLSEDTNFYCLYYQWGLEMLQVLATSGPLSGNMLSGVSGPETALIETPSKTDGSSSAPISTSIKNVPKIQNVIEHSQEPPNNVASPRLVTTKDDLSKPDTAASSTNAQPVVNENGNTPKTGVQKGSVPLTNNSEASSNKEPKVILAPKKKTDTDVLFDQSEMNNESKQQQSADLDGNNENDFDGDDDPPPESQPANVGDEPGVLPDPNIDDQKGKKKNVASIVSSLNVEMSQREFYSNTMQDGFAEDDDHFFSFFLTAIILVIFLYVLYHNKSKFRKVLLGLLVEGRQAARRRSGRGHEYRRLDTLEQAMSASSAAPPSKIIY